jgi:hypothetical protein
MENPKDTSHLQEMIAKTFPTHLSDDTVGILAAAVSESVGGPWCPHMGSCTFYRDAFDALWKVYLDTILNRLVQGKLTPCVCEDPSTRCPCFEQANAIVISSVWALTASQMFKLMGIPALLDMYPGPVSCKNAVEAMTLELTDTLADCGLDPHRVFR